MVHDSPTNERKNDTHHNTGTLSIKYCENCKPFAPTLNVITTKNINKTKDYFPAMVPEMIVTQRAA